MRKEKKQAAADGYFREKGRGPAKHQLNERQFPRLSWRPQVCTDVPITFDGSMHYVAVSLHQARHEKNEALAVLLRSTCR